jgi:hypothetical protein
MGSHPRHTEPVMWAVTADFSFTQAPMIGAWSDVFGRRPFMVLAMLLASAPILVVMLHLNLGVSLAWYYPFAVSGAYQVLLVVSYSSHFPNFFKKLFFPPFFGMLLGSVLHAWLLSCTVCVCVCVCVHDHGSAFGLLLVGLSGDHSLDGFRRRRRSAIYCRTVRPRVYAAGDGGRRVVRVAGAGVRGRSDAAGAPCAGVRRYHGGLLPRHLRRAAAGQPAGPGARVVARVVARGPHDRLRRCGPPRVSVVGVEGCGAVPRFYGDLWSNNRSRCRRRQRLRCGLRFRVGRLPSQ